METLSNINKGQLRLLVIAVMLVTIIEVLDMTIVTVALPHMMGNLGASSDQITWIVTSYIVASVIVMPLTGFLVNFFGRKRLLLICVSGFMVASILCGLSVNILQMVFFRVLQGAFGATLIPLSQYILQDSFPPEKQEKAMAFWGMGVMVAPVFGPTIGGFITEGLNWRWIFFLNIPVCILALFLILKAIPETLRKPLSVDKVGLFWMALGVAALQIFLDEGNTHNWLASDVMLSLMLISIFSLVFFIYRGLKINNNIINIRLFADRNFAASTIVLSLACIGFYSLTTIQPILLEHLLHFPVAFTGLILAPRGVTCAIAMFVVAAFSSKVDPRIWVVVGLLFSATGTYLVSNLTLETSYMPFIISCIIQGFGMGLLFVPLSVLALTTLAPKDIAEGTGLFSFGRSLGGSIGISIISTLLTRATMVKWNEIGAAIDPTRNAMQYWLSQTGLDINAPVTIKLLGYEVYRQSSMVAFNNCHWLLVCLFIILIPFALLIKKPGRP